MSSSAPARFLSATVLSCVALLALFMLWFGISYGLSESGTIPHLLLTGATLVAMILSVVGIFTLLWFRPNRHRRDEQIRNRMI